MAKQRDRSRSRPEIPAQPREDRLPSWTIPEDRFEHACLDLARIEFPALRPELKETKGAKQYEVDVECFDDDQEPVVVIQCKRYKEIKPSQYIRWIEAFIEELDGHWKDRNVKNYVLAVTVEGNREEIKEKTREAARRLKRHGIQFSPWFNATLTDLFRRDESIIRRYFNSAWVNAISAKTPVSLKNAPNDAEAGTTVGLSQLSEVIALSDQVDLAIEQALDALEREAKAGNSARLRRYLVDQRTSRESWKRVGPATRARMLRRLMMFAVDDGDLPNAEALFEEAKSLAPSKDKTSEAHLVRLKSGVERAITFLEGTDLDAEKELLAGFYIAADMNRAAEKLLLSLPETAERERLAALVYLGAQNRQIALQRAQRAVELRPESYGAKLVWLLAHFTSALIDGVRIEFTAAPNPFNPVVVRADDRAREHLDRGLELVEQLLATTAGRVRSDLEVWKLVLLVCHPDRRADVAAYADAVLNSDRPSPMFIVWALSIGLQLRTGKLRKYLEDEVRRGRGDATNVVVAALLLKDKDGNSDNATRLIEKYRGRWSDADDYLDEWRGQISGNSQLIVAIDNHSSDEFDRLADEALNRSTDRRFQLTAAQVLNDRQAYQQVLRLEECLLAVGNASSVLILAEAKIEAGFPDQAAKLLESNKAVFGGAQLPLSALRLEAMAADRAGKFGSTLKALVRLEERAPNAVNQVQILQRARVIKDASTIKLYARKLVDQQKVDGFGRLIAADAVAPHDVELAQTLLEKFIAADDANPMAATKIWELANTYGMRRVADSEAFQELFQDALRNGPHVIQFDDVHQAIAHIEQMNVAQRELREKWLLGHTPTHAAFGSDGVAFVEMFLSEKTEITTMNGDQYPRIIEAAGLPDRPNLPALENSKPLLLLDLSALLLASRYGLLEAITRTFQCHVPRTMILALEDFRDQIHRSKALDDDIRQRIMLADERLRGLARKSGQNVEEISVERTLPGEESSASTIEFVEALGRAGCNESNAQQLRQLLGIAPDLEFEVEAATKCYRLDAGTIVCLVSSDLLQDADDLLDIRMAPEDRDRLIQACVRDHELAELEDHVDRACQFVAQRLSADEWLEWNSHSDEPDEDAHQNPSLMSLSTCLKAVSDPQKPSVVIADRYVQRHRFPNVIHFTDLVDVLVSRSAVSSFERAKIWQSLQNGGAGFLPIDADQFVTALKAVNISRGAVVETARLIELRRSFAKQSRLLPFVDWNERRFVDGYPIGDPKFAIDLAFFPAVILEAIWCDVELNQKKKEAISDWIWTFLRIEALSAGGSGASDVPEEKRFVNNLAATFVKMATWPFFRHTTEQKSDQWASLSPYLDWLFGMVLVPRFKVDPAVKMQFVGEFSRILQKNSHINEESLTESERVQVDAYFARQLADFIELFPHNVRELLLDEPGFAKTAGFARGYTIDVGDRKISVDDVSAAIGQATNSEKQPVELGGSGATLTLVEGDSATATDVLITDEDQEVRLAAETAAILHPSKSRRLEEFEAIADKFATSATVKEELRKAHASDSSADGRVTAFNTAREHDFAFFEVRLRELIARRGQLTDREFELPRPQALAAYLRIDLSGGEGAAAQLAQGYEQLSRELGLEIADRRYSACPLRFDRGDVYFDGIPSRGDSVFQFASALEHAASGGADSARQDVETQWNRLCEVFAWEIDLFTLLVNMGADEAAYDRNWQEMDNGVAIALIWIWADRICSAFITHHVDVGPLIETLRRRQHRLLTLVLDDRYSTDGLSRLGRHLTEAKVALLLLERLKSTFPALSDEQRSQIRDWIGAKVDDDKEWMVDLSILFEDSSVWGSSVGGLMIGSEEFLTLVPNPQHWDGFNRDELIESALKTMESSAALGELSLVIAINPGLLNRNQLDRLWSHLDELISMPELDFSQEAHTVWLTLFARASAHLDRRHEFFKRLKPLAGLLAKQDDRGDDILDPNPSPGSRAAAYSGVVDAIIAFVAECNAPLHEKGRILFEQLGEIAEAWPDTGSSTLRLMSTLLNQLPSEAANDCWPIMRQARSHL